MLKKNLKEKVVVYKDHIEVTFNVAFSLLKNKGNGAEVINSIKRYDLCERYSDSFILRLAKKCDYK